MNHTESAVEDMHQKDSTVEDMHAANRSMNVKSVLAIVVEFFNSLSLFLGSLTLLAFPEDDFQILSEGTERNL